MIVIIMVIINKCKTYCERIQPGWKRRRRKKDKRLLLGRVVPLNGGGAAGARPYLIESLSPPAGPPPGPSTDQSDSSARMGPPHKFPQARAVEPVRRYEGSSRTFCV